MIVLSLWGEYADVLAKGFFQRALIESVLIGILCGIVGTFVVLRGYAFIGDALAHATFPGVAIAYLWRASVLGGALAAGFVTSFLIGWVARHRKVSNDTAIGVLFAGAFALGVVIVSRATTYTKDISSLLFGDVIGVSQRDIVILLVTGVLIVGTVAFCYRDLLLAAFDPTFAAAIGRPVGLIDALTLGLLTLTIVVGLQTVGNILIVALVVTPSATARLLTDRVPVMMLLGATIGGLSGAVGLLASYPLELAPGATIVIVATLAFFLALALSPKHGWLFSAIERRRKVEDGRRMVKVPLTQDWEKR
ncbi:MAG TPA: metal ABC transporter permease [Thermomicrobiaceae bacterium]|nr:metal ABC transporter permease [Thermomicrobiaceae bacterium]